MHLLFTGKEMILVQENSNVTHPDFSDTGVFPYTECRYNVTMLFWSLSFSVGNFRLGKGLDIVWLDLLCLTAQVLCASALRQTED